MARTSLLVGLLIRGSLALVALSAEAAVPTAAAPAPAPRPVVLMGHVSHSGRLPVRLSYHFNMLTFKYETVLSARPDAAGNFRLVVPGLAAPTEAHFDNGEQAATLFLTPGDHLRLTVVGTHYPKTIRYTGTGAAANNFLVKLGENADANLQNIPTAGSDTSTAPEMVARIAAFRQQQRDFLNTYAAVHPLPAVFKAYMRQCADFEQASYLLYYSEYRTRHPSLYQGEALPATYYDFLAALRPAQDSALAMNNLWCYNFLATYPVLLPTGVDTASTTAALAQMAAAFGTGRSRDLVLASYVYQQLKNDDAEQLAPLMARFRQLNRDSAMARLLRAQYVLLPKNWTA